MWGSYMFRNPGIDRLSLGNTEGYNKKVEKKYLQPLGINCPGTTPREDNNSLTIEGNGKWTLAMNMRS
jgi:hypothetical protein